MSWWHGRRELSTNPGGDAAASLTPQWSGRATAYIRWQACVGPVWPAAYRQRCYDLYGNRLCQKAFILAQVLSKSSDFLICAEGKSVANARRFRAM